MKKSIVILVLMALLCGFSNQRANAQETSNQKLIVFEEMVSPADMNAFWHAQAKVCDLWKEHRFDVPIYAYVNEESAFYWVIPIENFGSIDGLFGKFWDFFETMKDEDDFDSGEAFKGLYSGSQSIIESVQELSHYPKVKRSSAESKPFAEWTFFHLKAGHEHEADAVIKKYVDYYANIDLDYEWEVYKVLLGPDTPTYILMIIDEDEASMRDKEKELREKYKDDFDKLWNEFMQHIRKMETRKGWYLSEMSNLPQTE